MYKKRLLTAAFMLLSLLSITAKAQLTFDTDAGTYSIPSNKDSIRIRFYWTDTARKRNYGQKIQFRLVTELIDSGLTMKVAQLGNKISDNTESKIYEDEYVFNNIDSGYITIKFAETHQAREGFIAIAGYRWKLKTKRPAYADNQDNFLSRPMLIRFTGTEGNIIVADTSTNSSLLKALHARALLVNDRKEFKCSDGDATAWKDIQEKSAAPKSVFNETLKEIYGAVALNNDNGVKAGSNAAIVQDKTKGTISAAFDISRKVRHQTNFGINASSSGAFFNVFGPDSWYQNIGGSFGFTGIIPKTSGLYYNPAACMKNKKLRETWGNTVGNKFSEILLDQTIEAQIRDIDETLSPYYNRPVEPVMYDSLVKRREILTKKLELREKYLLIIRSQNKDSGYKKLENLVLTEMEPYEKTNNLYSGYNFEFIDFKIGASYTQARWNVDSVAKAQQKDLKSQGFVNVNLNVSYNFTWMTDITASNWGSMRFFQINLLGERSSILDQPGVINPPKLFRMPAPDTTNYAILDADSKDTLGFSNQFKKALYVVTPGFYYGALYGKKQTIGFDVRASFRFLVKKFEGALAENSYTCAIGPIFRVTGQSDFSIATIGIKAGLFAAPYKTDRLWKDYFGLRLEVGVPFKWYHKKTES